MEHLTLILVAVFAVGFFCGWIFTFILGTLRMNSLNDENIKLKGEVSKLTCELIEYRKIGDIK